jgi:isocitrate lyase
MSSNGTNGNGSNGSHSNGNGNKRNPLSLTTDPRWSGVTRPYSYSDVPRLRGRSRSNTRAAPGWSGLNLMHTDAYVPALGPSREIKPLKWCRPD